MTAPSKFPPVFFFRVDAHATASFPGRPFPVPSLAPRDDSGRYAAHGPLRQSRGTGEPGICVSGMHCGCASTLLPVGEEDLLRIAREDGPCSDHPFITDFDSIGASATIPARYESRPGTTPCGERTSNPAAFRILRSDSAVKVVSARFSSLLRISALLIFRESHPIPISTEFFKPNPG